MLFFLGKLVLYFELLINYEFFVFYGIFGYFVVGYKLWWCLDEFGFVLEYCFIFLSYVK